jgi:hypothetical protein
MLSWRRKRTRRRRKMRMKVERHPDGVVHSPSQALVLVFRGRRDGFYVDSWIFGRILDYGLSMPVVSTIHGSRYKFDLERVWNESTVKREVENGRGE